MENTEVKETVEQTKTYTKEDVEKIIQSESDKVRTKYNKQIKALEEELQTLRPITPSKEEIALKERIEALNKKEKALNKKELEFRVMENLENKGLNKQLVKYLNIQGADEDLETYLEEFAEVIKKQTNNFIPKDHNSKKMAISKEEFNKMSYLQKQDLYVKDKDLYNKLNN